MEGWGYPEWKAGRSNHSKHSADGKSDMVPRVHLSALKSYETPFYFIMNFQMGGTAKFSALSKDWAWNSNNVYRNTLYFRYQ